MRTVKSLIEELQKFPPGATCFAYEGEVSGLIVNYGNQYLINGAIVPYQIGTIHCGEGDRDEPETEHH